MYTMYDWEVVADAMEEVAEWENMKSDFPTEEEMKEIITEWKAQETNIPIMEFKFPTDEEMEEMARYYGEA